VLLAAAVGGGVAVWRHLAPPPGVPVWTVDRGEVEREAYGTGLLESVTMVDLGFDLPGRIARLMVDEGDAIEAGQVLGEIDGAELEGQLGVTEASRALAELSAQRATADIEKAQALRDRARADFARAERLAESGAIPLSERDSLATRQATAEADYRAALAVRAQLRQGVAVARESRGVAHTLAERTRLRSPIDGFVVARPRHVGDTAQPGVTVFRVAERRLHVRAWLDEMRLAELAEGQVARVVLRSQPEVSYAGKVTRIAREADRQTHEVLVDVELVKIPERFALGQRADVFVSTMRRAGVVRAPLEVCIPAEGGCLVERAGRAAFQPIESGLVGSTFFEVLEGLAPGDRLLAPKKPGGTLELVGRGPARGAP
jgi:HlyD family secretion protein